MTDEAATRGWLPVVVPVTCLVVVYALAWLVVVLLLGMAAGLDPVVLTSGSMEPGAARGDVVLLDEPGAVPLGAGTVITFENPVAPGRLVTHRIDRVLPDGTYRTRGDANRGPDSTPVPPASVVGVGRVLIPMVALPVVWLGAGQAHLVALLAFAVLVAVAGARLPGGDDVEPEAAGSGTREPLRGPPAPSVPAGGLRSTPSRTRRRRSLPWMLTRCSLLVVLVATLTTVSGQRALAVMTGSTTAAGSWHAGTLAAPTDVTASFTCGVLGIGKGVNVGWTGVTGADRYEVWRAVGSGSPSRLTTVTAPTTNTKDTSVNNSTTYHYTVRAVVGSWVSPVSVRASVTTPSALLCPL